MKETFEDRCLSGMAVAFAAALACMAGGQPSTAGAPPPPSLMEARVEAIARAIAAAEGYYVPGEHDGRSLPYRLNNPGALKKPALGAGSLPTWKETGLVLFPNADAGWKALRHQVRMMLAGTSRIYEPTDTLLLVGAKYADGDMNWGVRVASELGVPPDATLEELASRGELAIASGAAATPRP